MASFGVEPAQSGRSLTPACHWAPLRPRTTMPSSPGVAVTWAAAVSNRSACAQPQSGGQGGGGAALGASGGSAGDSGAGEHAADVMSRPMARSSAVRGRPISRAASRPCSSTGRPARSTMPSMTNHSQAAAGHEPGHEQQRTRTRTRPSSSSGHDELGDAQAPVAGVEPPEAAEGDQEAGDDLQQPGQDLALVRRVGRRSYAACTSDRVRLAGRAGRPARVGSIGIGGSPRGRSRPTGYGVPSVRARRSRGVWGRGGRVRGVGRPGAGLNLHSG